MRRARVQALAKINLALKVLGRRPDGYHELRTVFQTVSLADTLELEFTPSRRTEIELASSIEIAGNLVERAARLALEAMRKNGHVRLRLTKRIPMGAGLGGGSSDAAAVLLALPVLAGKRLPVERLLELAICLGSDVPFFLLGGTAVGLSRGTELYPLPDRPPGWGLIVVPDVPVSTAEAYRALGAPELTSEPAQNIISSFQSLLWNTGEACPAAQNDFEPVVFRHHSRFRSLKQRLLQLGAQPALLSGSGSAVFGLFPNRAAAERAIPQFPGEQAFPVSLVSRTRYRALWWRWLGAHVTEKVWPPQSRYA